MIEPTARPSVISVNVGQPRPLTWDDRVITTSIVKHPVDGPVRVRDGHVEGDRQADPEVHGTPPKAVYAYPAEHYPFWKRELPAAEMPFGMFGENLTTQGLSEETLHPGDRLRIGSVEFLVTRPRFPCIKLAFRFQREDMLRRFQDAGRSGFYLGIASEGSLEQGDAITVVPSSESRPTIAEIFRGDASAPGNDDPPAA
ncbi:MAG: MOSC domain-containing protein [Thermoplasmata archaeon]|nr:MOSC domain-containing protein [Thermoplasmata archaeon]